MKKKNEKQPKSKCPLCHADMILETDIIGRTHFLCKNKKCEGWFCCSISEDLCPCCKMPLDSLRDDNKLGFHGGVCRNNACKGWYCEYDEAYHPYGTSCSTASIRNMRSGTNYRESYWDTDKEIV